MAEAHSAVAFSFTVTHEGVDVNVNHDAIWAVWNSGVHSWKKRLGKAKNKVKAGTYPGSPSSWLFVAVIILAIRLADHDPSFGIIGFLQKYIPGLGSEGVGLYISCLLFSTLLWLAIILSLKYTLKVLLMYHGWMYEGRGPVSFPTRAWGLLIRMFGGRKPMLNSYQASLPKLFVPAVSDTISRYLLSVRPIYDDEKIARLTKLAHEFQSGLGKKLQRYLILKSWWATNYVSDWWEEYVYLRGRSPIMVNSNYYGVDAVLMHPTTNAAARAANVTYAMLQYRRELDREELNPILLNKTVPLCSAQYERQFNTTRIPGIETDRLVHLPDSKHVAVYHKGRFFKVYIHFKGQHLKPCELEKSFQKILDDTNPPVDGEELIPALTGGDRVPWAQARMEYFSKGKNKASLDAIEKAAFFVTFDDKEQNFVKGDQNTFDTYAQTMLHGNGSNRWFDKSFNLVVCPNGRIGFNAEHSWADAPIQAYLWEYMCATDCNIGYTEDGHTKGEAVNTPNPVRLEWDLAPECKKVIASSYQTCLRLISDVDLHFLMHDAFGKGLMKECKTSPDAFIQMALQLAYYRTSNKFSLTYESSMTRLFREGRTETVRPCTIESCAFVRAMEDPSVPRAEVLKHFKAATERHQQGYRDAMTGNGIDRHLFCLYVVSKYLEIEDPFLSEVLSEPWRLSTSQTPHSQTDKLELTKYPNRISGGGGFGPVADDGYGVSYIIAGEDVLFFHISCKKSCPTTSSEKFANAICKALADIKDLCLKK
ncbi:carnitine O-palmitoyltransferase 1, liver isoform-like isoform X2 [Dreissena polymorpha]|uniref:carnitine O-palmitoyltransferase 1, liver isoform-like isoform X2 n=1 Tax=Dreissena polymorpha TaxID=45954 RepID=UPI00226447B2|nr:carnitine O-palmitoyltransferase 1, liver isoform-like isoform X2 [Dreissena polymorpha]